MAEVPSRLQSPPELAPAEHICPTDALAALGAARVALNVFIAEANGWDGKRVMGDHPFFGTMDLYQYLSFIGHHERQHAAQIAHIRTAGADADA